MLRSMWVKLFHFLEKRKLQASCMESTRHYNMWRQCFLGFLTGAWAGLGLCLASAIAFEEQSCGKEVLADGGGGGLPTPAKPTTGLPSNSAPPPPQTPLSSPLCTAPSSKPALKASLRANSSHLHRIHLSNSASPQEPSNSLHTPITVHPLPILNSLSSPGWLRPVREDAGPNKARQAGGGPCRSVRSLREGVEPGEGKGEPELAMAGQAWSSLVPWVAASHVPSTSFSHRVPTAWGREQGGEVRRQQPTAEAGQVRPQRDRESRAIWVCWTFQSAGSCRGDLHCRRGLSRSPQARDWDGVKDPGAAHPASRQGRARPGPCIWEVQGAANPVRTAGRRARQEARRTSGATSPGLSSVISTSFGHRNISEAAHERDAICGRADSGLVGGATRGSRVWSGGKPYCDSC